jgi:hypothetical protein
MRLPTACRTTFCAGHAVERGYCKTCVKTNPRIERKRDHHDKLEKTKPWERCSKAHRELNPMCQLIVNGKQCTKTHPELFFDWRNHVSLCRPHHPDTPGDDPNRPRHYAPTQGILGAVFVHPTPLKTGEVRIGEGGVAEVGQ